MEKRKFILEIELESDLEYYKINQHVDKLLRSSEIFIKRMVEIKPETNIKYGE